MYLVVVVSTLETNAHSSNLIVGGVIGIGPTNVLMLGFISHPLYSSPFSFELSRR